MTLMPHNTSGFSTENTNEDGDVSEANRSANYDEEYAALSGAALGGKE